MTTTAARPDGSPMLTARAIGALWWLCIVTGTFGFMGDSKLIDFNDAALTAANIAAHETLYRVSFLASLASGAFYVGVTALLFDLLKVVNARAAVTAAFFGVVGIGVGGASWLSHVVPLELLRGGASLDALTKMQLEAVALAALKLQMPAFSIGMVFFGVQCMLMGYLIVRCTFLPRVLGVMLAAGGLCYLISCCVSLLVPSIGMGLSKFILPVALIGEGSVSAWLLLRGVNEERWMQKAGLYSNLARQATA